MSDDDDFEEDDGPELHIMQSPHPINAGADGFMFEIRALEDIEIQALWTGSAWSTGKVCS